jgi:bifunctional DNA-binding transcriptional regulator/antitoxin component of YhaV-PrlF toxin-antitoxin module
MLGRAMNAIFCRVSKSGRLSVPAVFRKAIGLERGGDVVVELDDRQLRITTVRDAIARAQHLSKRLLEGKPDMSVDDFIAERHREAERE